MKSLSKYYGLARMYFKCRKCRKWAVHTRDPLKKRLSNAIYQVGYDLYLSEAPKWWPKLEPLEPLK